MASHNRAPEALNAAIRPLVQRDEVHPLATECDRLRAEVARLNELLREERVQAVRTQDELRRKLARDLHDGPAQALATLAMSLDYVKKLHEQAYERVPEELELLKHLVVKTTRDLRHLLFELRPLILEAQGLGSALEAYTERINLQIGPRVRLEMRGLDQRLPLALETAAFAVVQEAVNNARKHAQARAVTIQATACGGWLDLTVRDDGQGFDVTAALTDYERRGSFGIAHLRERAAVVGGELDILSSPRKGTVIWFRAPTHK